MAVRVIEVRERVLQRNEAIAQEVRARLAAARVPALNLVSSPGSGKTTLLERTLRELGRELAIAVVTGDVQTQNDAERLARHTTSLVHAVVTGGACHLDASQVAAALDAIDLERTDLLVVENVGNLVCPAAWDLGESARAVVFSVTEGEDKPVKYPRLFRDSRWAILSKLDLLPYVPFDLHRAVGYTRDVNPNVELLYTSALTGEGMEEWYEALRTLVREARGETIGPRVIESPTRFTGEHAAIRLPSDVEAVPPPPVLDERMRRELAGVADAAGGGGHTETIERPVLVHDSPDALGMPAGLASPGVHTAPPPR